MSVVLNTVRVIFVFIVIVVSRVNGCCGRYTICSKHCIHAYEYHTYTRTLKQRGTIFINGIRHVVGRLDRPNSESIIKTE